MCVCVCVRTAAELRVCVRAVAQFGVGVGLVRVGLVRVGLVRVGLVRVGLLRLLPLPLSLSSIRSQL